MYLTIFPEVREIVDAGALNKPIKDYELLRYACYLIIQNVEPRKELQVGQKIFDYMGSTVLIANLFWISQTEEKLRKDSIQGADTATSL